MPHLKLTGKVRLPWCDGSTRMGIVPQHPSAPLDRLLALAQGYAEYAMRNIGHVPPALLADEPTVVIQFLPHNLKDVRAKDSYRPYGTRRGRRVPPREGYPR